MFSKKSKIFILIIFIFLIKETNKENIYFENTLLDKMPSMPYTLIIPKIDFKKSFSSESTLDDNIKIHEKSVLPIYENSTVILLGHSGYNENAYFNDLFDLKKDDIIYLKVYGKIYKYKIISFSYIDKNSKYKVNFNNDKLYLVTCDRFDLRKQYVINSRKL